MGDEEAALRESAHEALRAAGPAGGRASAVAARVQLPFSGHLEMTQRARKRNRRSRGSVRRKVLVALGIVLAAVVDHDRRRRGLGGEHLGRHALARHLEAGRRGLHLGRLRGRRQPPRLHPVGHDPPPGRERQDPQRPQASPRWRSRTSTSTSTAGSTTRPSSVPAWEDLKAGVGGPGRLDDHPAAGPQPLHRQSPGGHQAQDPRGRPGAASTRRGTRRTRSSPST